MSIPAPWHAARRPSAERRTQILTEAVRTFEADGYHGTSMAAISFRLGVTKPILYRHFGSKEELYIASVAFVVRSLITRLDALPVPVRTSASGLETVPDAEGDAQTIVRVHEELSERTLPLRIVLAAPSVSARVSARVDAEVAHLQRVVAAVIARDPAIDARRAQALAHLLTVLAVHERSPLSPDARGQRGAGLADLLEVIGAPSTAAGPLSGTAC